jgi:hypothetical protein
MDEFLTTVVSVLATLGIQYFRTRVKNATAQRLAKAILENPAIPVTSIPKALREAWVLTNHQEFSRQVDALQRQAAASELRIAGAEAARAADASEGHDVTLVPRDGSETFSPAWKEQ